MLETLQAAGQLPVRVCREMLNNGCQVWSALVRITQRRQEFAAPCFGSPGASVVEAEVLVAASSLMSPDKANQGLVAVDEGAKDF
eukprot:s2706_g6.t1